MGAVTFSLDRKLVEFVKVVLPLDNLVETGTFKGDSLELFKNDFRSLYSVELSLEYFETAKKRFAGDLNINLKHGNSAKLLKELSLKLKDCSALYFLDAHWCVASNTAGEASQCPLLEEIRALNSLNSDSLVVIDDARLFLAAPLAPHEISQWPTFDEVIKELHALSNVHEIAVVNDVIIYFPKRVRGEIQKYSQKYGLDWLRAASSISNDWLEISEEKELVIQDLILQLKEKEELIQSQHKTIKAYISAYGGRPIRSVAARVIRRTLEIIRPRIGNLNQHAPVDLGLGRSRKKFELTKNPCISIVTPSYNQGEFIEKSILSVIEQNYPRVEYYVIDGASADNTLSVIKKYQSYLAGWVSEPDTGQSNAINKGMLKTTGEIMCWLNSDDLLLTDALNYVVEYFENNPTVDVVYGNRILIDENDKQIGRWILPGHDGDILSWADFIPQETMFWRRRIWEKVGGKVDESYRFAMDWDLIIRFREADAVFAHIPEFLGAFRIHEQQKTSTVINEVGLKEMALIRERCLGKIPTQKEIRRAIFPFIVKHVISDIFYRIKNRFIGG